MKIGFEENETFRMPCTACHAPMDVNYSKLLTAALICPTCNAVLNQQYYQAAIVEVLGVMLHQVRVTTEATLWQHPRLITTRDDPFRCVAIVTSSAFAIIGTDPQSWLLQLFFLHLIPLSRLNASIAQAIRCCRHPRKNGFCHRTPPLQALPQHKHTASLS